MQRSRVPARAAIGWNDELRADEPGQLLGDLQMTMRVIDHVQLAMPKGEEAKARVFYVDVLGMVEIEKPPVLAERGGAWFRQDGVQIHLGVEENFKPAKKAHPAIKVSDGASLRASLQKSGYLVRDDDLIPGTQRFYTDDCFGNRIEFIELD